MPNIPTIESKLIQNIMPKLSDNIDKSDGFFVKPSSKDIWELIVEFMKLNTNHPDLLQVGDENIFNFIYQQFPEIQSRFSWIDTRYNVGVTQFENRLNKATKPIFIGAFKPNSNGHKLFKDSGLIPNELEEIFKKHIK